VKPSLPWYAWFPGDFLNATRGWSLLEKGGYHEALDTQWAIGALPADAEEFRRTIGASPREWRSIWPRIEPKFPVGEDGRRRNPRLGREQNKGERLRAERSDFGRAGAIKRWKEDGKRDGNTDSRGHSTGHDFANGKTMPSTSTSTSTDQNSVPPERLNPADASPDSRKGEIAELTKRKTIR
jgi:uncharacterized protein YdaU (DUF1376 family)